MPDFAQALSLILKEEGGRVDNAQDPGGRTNHGITQRTYDAWRKLQRQGTQDVYGITDAEVAAIYRKQYADVVRFDDLPEGIGYAVLDYAVNSGPARAAKLLQTCVGSKIDGVIGVLTIADTHKANASKLIEAYCTSRLQFLESLPTWPTFGHGWAARVVRVRASALMMVTLSAPKPVPVSAFPTSTAPTVQPVSVPAGYLPPKPVVGQATWGEWFKSMFFKRTA